MSDLLEPGLAENPTIQSPPPPPPKRRKWGRYVLYTLAVLGVLLIGLIAAAFIKANSEPQLIKIDETASIDEAMTRTYGKYSPEKKGWVYVDESNDPFVVRVIQQAKIEAVGASDELYFAVSGVSLKGDGRNFYGVFQIRADSKPGGGLVEVSSPYRYESDVAVTPEKVRFEALSERTWGWVLKVQNGTRPTAEQVMVSNVMLAPHGDEIALLARFKAAVDAEPADCAQANAEHETWRKAVEAMGAQEHTSEQELHEAETMDDTEPLRCERSRWTYRTADVIGPLPGPLTVSVKGTQYGAAMEAKTWKLMFDSKAFAYNVPDELAVE
ncbi:hypothetical protein [Duganella sp. HH105]|uniref:hypothetical protein n=1 Tax=Duganella sp. HH105 TaxID=1781067 RepID=UPI000893773D|nr:hypothetical protein [Duganella sp. HH105]OEZ57528.1 hypothetical protein DUGA6_44270 [Duganella sp. HH105]